MRPEVTVKYSELYASSGDSPTGFARCYIYLPQDINFYKVKIYTEGKLAKEYVGKVSMPAGDDGSFLIGPLKAGTPNRIELQVSVDGETYSSTSEIDAPIEVIAEDATKRPSVGWVKLTEQTIKKVMWSWGGFESKTDDILDYEYGITTRPDIMPEWQEKGQYAGAGRDYAENKTYTLFVRAVSKSGYHSNTLTATATSLTDTAHFTTNLAGRLWDTKVYFNDKGTIKKVKEIYVNNGGKIAHVRNTRRTV